MKPLLLSALTCLVYLSASACFAESNNPAAKTLLLTQWNWSFEIPQGWDVAHQSSLFEIKEQLPSHAFKQAMKKTAAPLLILTKKGKVEDEALTVIVNLIPVKKSKTDRSIPETTHWLAKQTQFLAAAHTEFKLLEKTDWLDSKQKQWAVNQFSFKNEAHSPPSDVHCAYLGRIVDDIALIIGVADPASTTKLSASLIQTVKQMIQPGKPVKA